MMKNKHGNLGRKHKPETIEKMRVAKLGKRKGVPCGIGRLDEDHVRLAKSIGANSRKNLMQNLGPFTVRGRLKISTTETRMKAIEGYGKVSATVLAEMLGVSRCTIIGHWFRARRCGQISIDVPFQ